MLGKTAGGVFWMFRYLERAENMARLIDVGFRIALTRSGNVEDEWASIISTSGVKDLYEVEHDRFEAGQVIDFLLRGKTNPSSVLSIIEVARNNARLVRTAITREVWEATNECWLILNDLLRKPVTDRELPEVLTGIRRQTALVRAALHGTMLRNDIFDFGRIGTFIERADNTARILDVKYYVLLPSIALVGSRLDNVQWDMILSSVSAQRSYRWLNGGDINARGITEFLILDKRMPRSLAFCHSKIQDNLNYLAMDYGMRLPCHEQAEAITAKFNENDIDSIFKIGMHEFIETFIKDNNALGLQIQKDYRFIE